MMAQARPMLTIGPKYLAQARPTGMVGSGLAREFRAGPGRADRAGLPMARYVHKPQW
jgi:hypothetical protein